MIRTFVLLFLWLCLGGLAQAHKASDSYLTLDTGKGGQVGLRWDIAVSDLDLLLDLDRNHDRELTWGELQARTADITALVRSALSVRRGDVACQSWQFAPLMTDEHSDGAYAVIQMRGDCPAQGDWSLQYRLLQAEDPSHRGIVLWQPEGAAAQTRIVAASAEPLTLIQPSHSLTFHDFWKEGVFHIWSGYDHILFLLSLLLPVVLIRQGGGWQPISRWPSALRDAAGIVTAFTLAHSLTLVLAALQWVHLPSRLVESAIALSVLMAAMHNLKPVLDKWRFLMAFAFGLIHGFGFASALTDLSTRSDSLLVALLGFNLGVESGQLLIVGLFVPAAYVLRRSALYQRAVVTGGSVAIAVVAGLWLGQRILNVVWIPG